MYMFWQKRKKSLVKLGLINTLILNWFMGLPKNLSRSQVSKLQYLSLPENKIPSKVFNFFFQSFKKDFPCSLRPSIPKIVFPKRLLKDILIFNTWHFRRNGGKKEIPLNKEIFIICRKKLYFFHFFRNQCPRIIYQYHGYLRHQKWFGYRNYCGECSVQHFWSHFSMRYF